MRPLVTMIMSLVALATAPRVDQSHTTTRHRPMHHHATGPFEVKLGPLEPYDTEPGAGLGRYSIDKQFHGGLEAVSKGEMLSAGSASGSGGYVAIERVTGSLDGRQGSFALQHKGTMTAGTPALDIMVVPGSGTRSLDGLSGRMTIHIAPDGAHTYEFDYELTAGDT